MLSLIEQRFETMERPIPLFARAVAARVRGGSAALDSLLDAVARGTESAGERAPQVAVWLGDFATAERLARIGTMGNRPAAARFAGHYSLAWLAAARGRWKDAYSELTEAEQLQPNRLLRLFRAVCALTPLLAVPHEDLEAIRQDLLEFDPAEVASQASAEAFAAVLPHGRLYLLGLLSARLGADEEALEYAAQLERLTAPANAAAVPRDLARTLRADVALRRGGPAQALAILEPVRGEVPLELVHFPLYSQEYARYLRAQSLLRLGRAGEALRWLEAGFDDTPTELLYRAPLHLRRGEAHERLGEHEQARQEYERFIALWNQADAEVQPLVSEVKGRLARLSGERVLPSRSR